MNLFRRSSDRRISARLALYGTPRQLTRLEQVETRVELRWPRRRRYAPLPAELRKVTPEMHLTDAPAGYRTEPRPHTRTAARCAVVLPHGGHDGSTRYVCDAPATHVQPFADGSSRTVCLDCAVWIASGHERSGIRLLGS